MVVSPSQKTARIQLPEDGPLMQMCRLPDAQRLLLGGASEDSDQRRLKSYIDRLGVLWTHPTNEAERNPAAAGSALARGLKKGVPDILIFKPFTYGGAAFSGLAVELKRADATPCAVSDDQRRWLASLRTCGWMAEWARGFTEAEKLVRRAYGGG